MTDLLLAAKEEEVLVDPSNDKGVNERKEEDFVVERADRRVVSKLVLE